MTRFSSWCMLLVLGAAGCAVEADDGSELASEGSDGISVAPGATLTIASASASIEDAATPAKNAIDGSLSTRWSGKGVGASVTGKLGALSRVDQVGISWYRGNLRVNHFVVSVSKDGTSYTDVIARDSSGSTNSVETYVLPTPTLAQFVRITVNGNSENTWASLNEMRIVGSSDITSPETTLASSGPPQGSTQTTGSAAFAFSSNDARAAFQCRINAGAWAGCTSPKSYSSLAAATYTFEVRAVDAAGNVDSSPARRVWSVASVVGVTKPGRDNTGVPTGTVLSRLNGNQIIDAAWMAAHPTGMPAGAGAGIMQNQDIYGTVSIRVPNFTLRRSIVRGKQTQPGLEWIALVNVTVGSSTGSPVDVRSTVVIEDSEIAPTYPSSGTTGVYGYNFTARRLDIHHTVDGFGIWWFTNLEANWVHDLTYFDEDGGHTNGTHNDCVQLHAVSKGPGAGGSGGRNRIVGNRFQAFIAQDAGTPATQARTQLCVPTPGAGWDHQAMSAFMINKNVSNTVTDNWIEGGFVPVNGLDLGNADLDLGTWQRNKFDRMRYDNPNAYYGSGGSYDAHPRLTLSFQSQAIVNAGAGTTNRNVFDADSVMPGVTPGGEVTVRY